MSSTEDDSSIPILPSDSPGSSVSTTLQVIQSFGWNKEHPVSSGLLKALYTFGSCQRLAFTVGVSKHICIKWQTCENLAQSVIKVAR